MITVQQASTRHVARSLHNFLIASFFASVTHCHVPSVQEANSVSQEDCPGGPQSKKTGTGRACHHIVPPPAKTVITVPRAPPIPRPGAPTTKAPKNAKANTTGTKTTTGYGLPPGMENYLEAAKENAPKETHGGEPVEKIHALLPAAKCEAGNCGRTGIAGIPGAPGAPGVPGMPGPPGPQGKAGRDGIQGPPGKMGMPGIPMQQPPITTTVFAATTPPPSVLGASTTTNAAQAATAAAGGLSSGSRSGDPIDIAGLRIVGPPGMAPLPSGVLQNMLPPMEQLQQAFSQTTPLPMQQVMTQNGPVAVPRYIMTPTGLQPVYSYEVPSAPVPNEAAPSSALYTSATIGSVGTENQGFAAAMMSRGSKESTESNDAGGSDDEHETDDTSENDDNNRDDSESASENDDNNRDDSDRASKNDDNNGGNSESEDDDGDDGDSSIIQIDSEVPDKGGSGTNAKRAKERQQKWKKQHSNITMADVKGRMAELISKSTVNFEHFKALENQFDKSFAEAQKNQDAEVNSLVKANPNVAQEFTPSNVTAPESLKVVKAHAESLMRRGKDAELIH